MQNPEFVKSGISPYHPRCPQSSGKNAEIFEFAHFFSFFLSLKNPYTVPKATHISEKCLKVYMGASPLAGKFPKAVYPTSLQKFPRNTGKKQKLYWKDSIHNPAGLEGNQSNLYTIAPCDVYHKFFLINYKFHIVQKFLARCAATCSKFLYN